jgi:tellurite resistance protein
MLRSKVLKKFQKTTLLLGAICAAAMVTGCANIGQTPSPSADDVKSNFDKQPLDARAETMMKSPAPAAQKLQMIKDMYAKEGKQVPEKITSALGGDSRAH